MGASPTKGSQTSLHIVPFLRKSRERTKCIIIVENVLFSGQTGCHITYFGGVTYLGEVNLYQYSMTLRADILHNIPGS